VKVNEHPGLTQQLPTFRPAQVIVKLKDQSLHSASAQTNKGDAEDPYSSADVVAKFHEVAAPHIGDVKANAVVSACLSLDTAPSLRAITDLCEVL
jgi:2-methylcitrate dehydratase PrpD